MCNLSDGIFEYGEATGISIGEARGEIKGAILIYHEELKLQPVDIIQKIMARFSIGQEQAKQYVSETLGVHTS